MRHRSAPSGSPLRVAFIAGSLVQGGAEKQLVYMARALRDLGIHVQVYGLTHGEFYERVLRADGLPPIWVGRLGNPAARVATLMGHLGSYRPHIVQSSHFFGNLYAAIVGRLCGALAVGSIRNDARFDVNANGHWGKWLLRTPQVLLANSWAARENAAMMGILPGRVHVLPNVIDLPAFDQAYLAAQRPTGGPPVAVAVCRLVAAKRLDRFVRALALARRQVPELRGVIVGDGPERGAIEALAASLPGLDGALTFAGLSGDVPLSMSTADMLVLCSEHEGFPNVVLEAMAARLPVVATPVGDVTRIVDHDRSGYIVAREDVNGIATHIVRLARDPDLRARLGEAGRARVEQSFTFTTLGARLVSVYASMARARGQSRTLGALEAAQAA